MLIFYIALFAAVTIVNLVKIMVYKRDKPFFVLDDSILKWPVLFLTLVVFWFVFTGGSYKYLLIWLAIIEIGDFVIYIIRNNSQ